MPAPVDITDPFRALADPTRRAILDLLAPGTLPVRVIAGRFPEISRPAVSKHLRVLREGGLVTEERSGRERYYRVESEAVREALDWMAGIHQDALDGGRPRAKAPSKGSTPKAAARTRTRASKPAQARQPPPAPRVPRTSTRKSPRSAPEGDDWKAW